MGGIPSGVMFSQIEQSIAARDYPPFNNPCIRLVGVSADDFLASAFNSPGGCQVFLIDVDRDAVADLAAAGKIIPEALLQQVFQWVSRQDRTRPDTWLRIEYTAKASERSQSYAYELFAGVAQQTPIRIDTISLVMGPMLTSNYGSAVVPHLVARGPFELHAFHVGQGMCSMLHNASCGFLFDAGAGTPIKRGNYQAGLTSAGNVMQNDLLMRVGSKPVQMILSHPDSDH